MSEREKILVKLVSDVLGPRRGPRESLPPNCDPVNEYVTGCLAPQIEVLDIDIEQTEEIEAQTTDGEEDDADAKVPVQPPIIHDVAPALDPRARPRTMGLSFVVEYADEHPYVEVCATWARYVQSEDTTEWKRVPHFQIISDKEFGHEASKISEDGVSLVVRAREKSDKQWRVSIYLINSISAAEGRPSTEEHVFQPEIRVAMGTRTSLVPLEQTPGRTHVQDERSLWLLYKGKPVLARGHLCGAIWREIDPQVQSSFDRPAAPPFVWGDGNELPKHIRERFDPPDLRTTFVPVYSITTPDFGWRSSNGAPELDPESLSECWDRELMRVALEPLVDSYESWISEQNEKCKHLDAAHSDAGLSNLSQCQEAAGRLRNGIDIICSDSNVRLAFCFANKAISLQAKWANRDRPTYRQRWRPFQLAFIILSIPGLASPRHSDVDVCDLLWISTGGGKTEAYLGVAAFVIALRRLRSNTDSDGHRMGEGVAVLSRYTLRLLSIQQFRRALRLVTACEYLRVLQLGSGVFGWRPSDFKYDDNFIWGGARFSIGLWVGGSVTPNRLESVTAKDEEGTLWWFPGAVDLLSLEDPPAGVRRSAQRAEPAQVTNCPACDAILAVGSSGLGKGRRQLHFVIDGNEGLTAPDATSVSTTDFEVRSAPKLVVHEVLPYYTLSLDFVSDGASPEQIGEWWRNIIRPALKGQSIRLASAHASRPGYFLRGYSTRRTKYHISDFEIYCPNPTCDLSGTEWGEKVPVPIDCKNPPSTERSWQEIVAPFRRAANHRRADRVLIPAYTVDDQTYRRCPSVVIATVDKFARLAFESDAAGIFGNVEFYHGRSGFYRAGSPPGRKSGVKKGHPPTAKLAKAVRALAPPQLIIQDELHLVEGPLGSMVGLYETVIEKLSERILEGTTIRPKYVASTATVRQANEQVRAIFNRQVANFPPPGLSVDDNFFARGGEAHALDSRRPGRLYVGLCAPGRGALTPIVRVWSSLLQTVWERRQAGAPLEELDPFWTLVGYFNAIRELAGAVALYRQDIRQRLPEIAETEPRPLPFTDPTELSSRQADAMRLPGLLDALATPIPEEAVDAAVATSMFGTGVDVSRLGLMVVHGQPKTTASYIQATGRVGRGDGGLVVVLLRAARVRDLAHYEFFTGYHRQLHRYVEPVTVAPFSPRARERALGPLAVTLLRQASSLNGKDVNSGWRIHHYDKDGNLISSAPRMGAHRRDDEVMVIPSILEERAGTQPTKRAPLSSITETEGHAWLDRWEQLARMVAGSEFLYYESTMMRGPRSSVVLGDPAHNERVPAVVFENAPNSLREVEATTAFKTKY